MTRQALLQQTIDNLAKLPDQKLQEALNFVESIRQQSQPNKIKERQFGYAQDFFTMAPDFDEPLDDFKEYR